MRWEALGSRIETRPHRVRPSRTQWPPGDPEADGADSLGSLWNGAMRQEAPRALAKKHVALGHAAKKAYLYLCFRVVVVVFAYGFKGFFPRFGLPKLGPYF